MRRQRPRSADHDARRRPRLLRVVLVVLLAFAVLVVLFTQVFPRLEGLIDQPTLGAGAGMDAIVAAG